MSARYATPHGVVPEPWAPVATDMKALTGFRGTGFDGTGFDGTGFGGTGFGGTGFDGTALTERTLPLTARPANKN